MTEVSLLGHTESKELRSNLNFDNVGEEKKKPESGNSGLGKTRDSGESAHGFCDKAIVADLPNFYNNYGIAMENSGYFSFPRSISSDPRYRGARLKYKHVLHTILEYAAFRETTHAIGVEVVKIEIGQFCVSIRGLVDLCNKGVKYKDDLVDKNVVERASRFWATCGFVRQEVRHGKIILSVTVPEFYIKEKNTSETPSETKVRQNRDTKETLETHETLNISSEKEAFQPSSFATSLLSEFYSSLFLAIPDFPKESAKKTKTQYQAADAIGKKAKNDMDLIRKVIAYAHTQGGFWLAHVHSVSYLNKKFATLVQQLRSQGKKPMNGQKPDSLHNKSFTQDKSPKKYNNTYDFSK